MSSISSNKNYDIFTREYPRYGGTLIDTACSDIVAMNPVLTNDSTSHKINSLLFENLISYNKDMQLVPRLAKDYTISTNQLVYTFHLRNDVYWHDGEQFTADDVIFTWDRILDPETDLPKQLQIFKNCLMIEKTPFEKIDEYTVSFYFKVAKYDILAAFTQLIIPEHAYENHLGPDGVPHTVDDCRDAEGTYSFNDDPRNTAAEGKMPCGTGSMMFHEWEVADHITLIRNSENNGGPGYWDGHDAYLDRYLLRVIGDVNVQLLALQNHDISMMDLSSTPLDDVEELHIQPDFDIFRAPTFSSDYIAYQTDPSKGNFYGSPNRDFNADPNHLAGYEWQAKQYPSLDIYGYKVRQALNYALDKKAIIEVVYPYGERVLGPIHVAETNWYNHQLEPYSLNYQKANSLLNETGFGVSPESSKRSQLDFIISYGQGNIQHKKICSVAQAMWANLGINVSVEQLDYESMDNMYENRNFDATVIHWNKTCDRPYFANTWLSSNIKVNYNPIGIDSTGHWIWSAEQKAECQNIMSYWNPVVDDLLGKIQAEFNFNVRKNYYAELQHRIVSDAPCCWLFSYSRIFGVRTCFAGFVDNSVAGLWPEPVGFHNIYSLY